jgi:hypothetical protein
MLPFGKNWLEGILDLYIISSSLMWTYCLKIKERKYFDYARWLKPVILDTCRWSSAGGLLFEASPGKKLPDSISTNGWAQWCEPVIPVTQGKQGSINKRIAVQAVLSINQDPMLQITNTERAGAELKHKTLSSNTITTTPERDHFVLDSQS